MIVVNFIIKLIDFNIVIRCYMPLSSGLDSKKNLNVLLVIYLYINYIYLK